MKRSFVTDGSGINRKEAKDNHADRLGNLIFIG